MKLKNKLIISFIILIIILIINTKVKAATASISASSKEVTVGTNVTITTKINGASWQINLSGAVSEAYSDATSDAEDTTKTETTTFKPSKAGTYTINLSGNVTGSNDTSATKVSDSVTITVKDESSATVAPAPVKTLSSDATLLNLGINPYDFSGFKAGTTTYNVNVPKNISKINIYASKRNGQTITGTGDKTLNIGNNKFDVTVTAEDGKTTKTYTINVTRESISNVATLRDLGITPNDFSNFRSDITSYNVSVPYETEKINIYAKKNSDGQVIEGIGEKTLEVGENTFEIKVTAEDKKTTNTYKLIINRKKEGESDPNNNDEQKNEPEEQNVIKGLTNIKVGGYTLKPQFSNDIYKYNIEITDETKELDLKTETSSDKINVEVVGNENLKVGENIITILVKDTETDETTTYQLVVNSKQSKVDVTAYNNIVDNTQDNLRKKQMLIGIIIIAVSCLIIAFAIYKIKLQRDDDYYDDEEDDDDDDDEYDDNDEQGDFVPPIEDNSNRNIVEEIVSERENKNIENEENTESTEKSSYEEFKQDETKKNKKHVKGKRFK